MHISCSNQPKPMLHPCCLKDTTQKRCNVRDVIVLWRGILLGMRVIPFFLPGLQNWLIKWIDEVETGSVALTLTAPKHIVNCLSLRRCPGPPSTFMSVRLNPQTQGLTWGSSLAGLCLCHTSNCWYSCHLVGRLHSRGGGVGKQTLLSRLHQ